MTLEVWHSHFTTYGYATWLTARSPLTHQPSRKKADPKSGEPSFSCQNTLFEQTAFLLEIRAVIGRYLWLLL